MAIDNSAHSDYIIWKQKLQLPLLFQVCGVGAV